MGTYGVPPLALVRGEGCRAWDADGKEYTDLIAGIAVSSLDHAHPALTEAVTRQVRARPVIVAADGGFHGRTMGSLALSGKEAIRQPFGPFGVEARFVPYGD